jgi:hypothetical protein
MTDPATLSPPSDRGEPSQLGDDERAHLADQLERIQRNTAASIRRFWDRQYQAQSSRISRVAGGRPRLTDGDHERVHALAHEHSWRAVPQPRGRS